MRTYNTSDLRDLAELFLEEIEKDGEDPRPHHRILSFIDWLEKEYENQDPLEDSTIQVSCPECGDFLLVQEQDRHYCLQA